MRYLYYIGSNKGIQVFRANICHKRFDSKMQEGIYCWDSIENIDTILVNKLLQYWRIIGYIEGRMIFAFEPGV